MGKDRIVKELEVSIELKAGLPGSEGEKEPEGWNAVVRDKGLRFQSSSPERVWYRL